MAAIDEPVGTFGATVAMAAIRLPNEGIPETLAVGQRGLTVANAVTYCTGYDAHVQLALRDLTRLPDADQPPYQERARDIIADLTASAIEAARHPERASKAADSYSQFLADRAKLALTQLAADVADAIANLPSTTTGSGGAAASFPPARVLDAQPW